MDSPPRPYRSPYTNSTMNGDGSSASRHPLYPATPAFTLPTTTLISATITQNLPPSTYHTTAHPNPPFNPPSLPRVGYPSGMNQDPSATYSFQRPVSPPTGSAGTHPSLTQPNRHAEDMTNRALFPVAPANFDPSQNTAMSGSEMNAPATPAIALVSASTTGLTLPPPASASPSLSTLATSDAQQLRTNVQALLTDMSILQGQFLKQGDTDAKAQLYLQAFAAAGYSSLGSLDDLDDKAQRLLNGCNKRGRSSTGSVSGTSTPVGSGTSTPLSADAKEAKRYRLYDSLRSSYEAHLTSITDLRKALEDIGKNSKGVYDYEFNSRFEVIGNQILPGNYKKPKAPANGRKRKSTDKATVATPTAGPSNSTASSSMTGGAQGRVGEDGRPVGTQLAAIAPRPIKKTKRPSVPKQSVPPPVPQPGTSQFQLSASPSPALPTLPALLPQLAAGPTTEELLDRTKVELEEINAKMAELNREKSNALKRYGMLEDRLWREHARRVFQSSQ